MTDTPAMQGASPGPGEASSGDVCERLITQLHADRYTDVLKYLVLHPVNTSERRLAAIAEHPARSRDVVGRGDTWAEALADLLRQLEAGEADV